MAESGVILPVDSTGKALRSETATTTFTTGSGGVVHQQVVTLADSTGVLLGTSAAPIPTIDPDVTASGTITATDAVVAAPGGAGVLVTGASTAGSLVSLASPGGESAWNVQITGLTSGTLYFEESLDSTTGTDGNWIAVNARQSGVVSTVIGISATSNGVFRGNSSGIKWFRVRSVGALTGTPAVLIRMSTGSGAVFLNASVPTGTNSIGTVQQATLTKGTQGATGVTSQDLKDAGRAAVSYYTVIPVLTSATDTLQTLTGTKGAATVTATTTPAVVTTGKTFRIQKVLASYVSTATSGYAMVRLRYNTGGVVAVTSPILASAAVGNATPGTANAVGMMEIPIPDGLEVPAGTGVGISVQGFAAVTATAVGYCNVTLTGYEY